MGLLLMFVLVSANQVDPKLARIVDNDGFTNVRSGPGLSFEIIDTVATDELFYCETRSGSHWYKINLIRPSSGKPQDRYIHKSRIQIIENLAPGDQKIIIVTILKRQKLLAEAFVDCYGKYNRVLKKWDNQEDKDAYQNAVRELESYSESRYSPILGLLPNVFCNRKEKTIVSSFIETMLSDRGSANELPSFSIGECFICDPEMVSEQIRLIKDREDRDIIISHVEWGLLNKFSVGENEKSTNLQFVKLKQQLEATRK